MLSFQCTNLPKMDKKGSLPNAICVLYDLSQGGEPVNIGMTEMVEGKLNPEFVEEILADYVFEQQQTFKVEIYDAFRIKSK